MSSHLEFRRLAWRLVVVGEIFYIACLLYGLLLRGPARDLHGKLFELLAGFSWSVGGIIIGAIWFAILALLTAWASVWLHNYSVEGRPR